MSKPDMNVALVVCGDADWEARTIRNVLEGFNVRVFWYPIGRPNDLIAVLNGSDLYPGTSHIVLSCHGEPGRLVMPKLGKAIYEADEPRGHFRAAEVRRYAHLEGFHVVNTGCFLGKRTFVSAFLDAGCASYIGHLDQPNGNAALFFTIRYFYELIHNQRSHQAAYEAAASTDDVTKFFKRYVSNH